MTTRYACFLVVATLTVGSAAAKADDMSGPVRTAQRHALVRAGHRDPLEQRVAMLTQTLQLDAGQQTEVRRLLERQRDETARIWEDPAVPAAYRVNATRQMSDQTSDRIRALLTDAQKQKFSKPRIERESPADALDGRTLEDWISVATHPDRS